MASTKVKVTDPIYPCRKLEFQHSGEYFFFTVHDGPECLLTSEPFTNKETCQRVGLDFLDALNEKMPFQEPQPEPIPQFLHRMLGGTK